jgi:hypothetical protein
MKSTKAISVLASMMFGGAAVLSAAIPAFAETPPTASSVPQPPCLQASCGPQVQHNQVDFTGLSLPPLSNTPPKPDPSTTPFGQGSGGLTQANPIPAVANLPTTPDFPINNPGLLTPAAANILLQHLPYSTDGSDQFEVINAGATDSGELHIAVLGGDPSTAVKSYDFIIWNLVPNEFRTYDVQFNDCHGGALILANVTLTTKNPPKGSVLKLGGLCGIDSSTGSGGSNGVPADN